MRKCGPCTVCCTQLAVVELGKKSGDACVNCAGGCTIQATKPESCAGYTCAWLNGWFRDEDRPDLLRAVVDTHRTVMGIIPIVHLTDDSVEADVADMVIGLLSRFECFAIIGADGRSAKLAVAGHVNSAKEKLWVSAFRALDTL